MTLTLIDGPANECPEGIVLTIFRRKDDMPKVSVADIVLVRSVKVCTLLLPPFSGLR